jgi:hypothetical protein
MTTRTAKATTKGEGNDKGKGDPKGKERQRQRQTVRFFSAFGSAMRFLEFVLFPVSISPIGK